MVSQQLRLTLFDFLLQHHSSHCDFHLHGNLRCQKKLHFKYDLDFYVAFLLPFEVDLTFTFQDLKFGLGYL